MKIIQYPWYAIIESEENLSQGDFIEDCPVIIPPKRLDQPKYQLDVKLYDTIIVTQSCDIQQDKIQYILVCPYYPLSKLEEINKFIRNDVGKEALRRGNINGLYLLNKCEIEGLKREHLVVDFRKVYSIYKDYLKEFVKQKKTRLRLQSPYREHLSQAFALFFMRIGLPEDITQFCDEIYKI